MHKRFLSPMAAFAVALAAASLAGCSGFGQGLTGTSAGSSQATSASSSTQSDSRAAPAGVAAQCNAQPAQFAVGQNSTARVMESARARAGAEMARVLRPGQMVTKEFNAQRLNLQVDANGRIVAVSCG